jgi:hypothetical protein
MEILPCEFKVLVWFINLYLKHTLYLIFLNVLKIGYIC